MKHVSKKQLIANRNNAKLGGVKTKTGKEISKYNALRHGILAVQTVIERGDASEDQDLYQLLRDQIFNEIKPVGIREIMLTDLLLSDYWRLQRALKTERAMIELQGMGHFYKKIESQKEMAEQNKTMAILRFYQRVQTSQGCKEMLKNAQKIATTIEEHGLPLDEPNLDLLMEVGLAQDFPKAETLWILHCMTIDKDKLEFKEEDIKIINDKAREAARTLERFFSENIERAEQIEQEEIEASLESHLLLNENDLSRIQRYEAHLRRNFTHALHELEGLQALRFGKPAPMTAALDITVNSENGFVS